MITRKGKPVTLTVPLKNGTRLSREQQQARKDLISFMEKGLPLRGETFTKGELHER